MTMRKKSFLFYLLLLLSSHFLISQDFSAKIIDAKTQKPIPYATVQTDEKKGVISNEEGTFTIGLEKAQLTSLTVSCLGYTKKTIRIEDIAKNNFTIALEESVYRLDEVFVSNKTPNADAIIAKVRSRLTENYRTDLLKYELFYRGTAYVDFDKLDLEVEKASHVKKARLASANSGLDSLTSAIMASKTIHFTDFKGDLWVKDKDSIKLSVEKATKLIDTKKDFSIENIQEKAQRIVLQYLDSTKTYKLKTGLIKIEDSLSLSEDAKKEKEKNEYLISHLKSDTDGVLKISQFYDGSFLNNILDPDRYAYSFEDATFFNDELIYIIQYHPKKAKAKFEGKLYISDDTHAILKTDYSYSEGKRGKKLNLKLILGIKYIENIKKGTIIYDRSQNNIYFPYYIKQEEGQYFYVNRPLKFIENSEKKNKVTFNFKIEGDMRHKEEVLFMASKTVTANDYDSLKEEENVPFELLKKYESSIWQNSRIIAPLEELKNFKASE